MDPAILKTFATGLGLVISTLGGIFIAAVTMATSIAGANKAAAARGKWVSFGAVKGAFAGFLLSAFLVFAGLLAVAVCVKAAS